MELSKVSRQWHNLSLNNMIWQKLVRQHFPEQDKRIQDKKIIVSSFFEIVYSDFTKPDKSVPGVTSESFAK